MNGISKRQWYAVRTKYKCEKFVASALAHRDIEVYLPLIQRKKHYVRKVKTYELPIINCYVFVRINLSDRVKVPDTMYVRDFIRFENEIVAIPEAEMEVMRRVAGDFNNVVTSPLTAQTGVEVEVLAGALTGLTGKLVAQRGKNEFVVELQTLGYELRMTMDRSVLRQIGAPQSATC